MTNKDLREMIAATTGMDTSVLKDDKAVVRMAKTLQKSGVLSGDLKFPKPQRGAVEVVQYEPKDLGESLTYVKVPSIRFKTPNGVERSGGNCFIPLQVVDQLVADLILGKKTAEEA